MEYVLGGLRLGAHTAVGKGHVRGDLGVEVVTHHNHVEQLGLRVNAERQRGVCRRGQHKWHRGHLQQVGSMSATCALGVVGVDGAAIDSGDSILYITTLVEGVGVDGHLYIMVVGHLQRGTYCGRSRAPILVNLQAAGSRLDLLNKRFLARAVTLAQETYIYRQTLGRLQHGLDVPATRGDGSAVTAVAWPYTATKQRCYTVAQGCIGLLWRDEVNVAIDSSRCEDKVLTRDSIGGCTCDHVGRYALHDIGVTRTANASYATIFHTHVCLYYAQHGVYYCHVGNNQVKRAFVRGYSVRKAHTVTQSLASAIHHLVAVATQVTFNLDIEVAVAQSDFVAHCWAE